MNLRGIRLACEEMECVAKEVYAFRMLSTRACATLLQRIDAYSQTVDARRPNSMNRYGTVLPYTAVDPIRRLVDKHFASTLRAYGGGDTHVAHAFTVRYKHGEDLHLDMHSDDSDITCNICLGRTFTGGDLAFCGQQDQNDHRLLQSVYSHRTGYAVVHAGTHRHGALPLIDGERTNLILWLKADRAIPRVVVLKRGADPVCVSHTHDPDSSPDNGVATFSHHTPFSQSLLRSTLLS